MYLEWDSNPHARNGHAELKSDVSTNSTIQAVEYRDFTSIYILYMDIYVMVPTRFELITA